LLILVDFSPLALGGIWNDFNDILLFIFSLFCTFVRSNHFAEDFFRVSRLQLCFLEFLKFRFELDPVEHFRSYVVLLNALHKSLFELGVESILFLIRKGESIQFTHFFDPLHESRLKHQLFQESSCIFVQILADGLPQLEQALEPQTLVPVGAGDAALQDEGVRVRLLGFGVSENETCCLEDCLYKEYLVALSSAEQSPFCLHRCEHRVVIECDVFLVEVLKVEC